MQRSLFQFGTGLSKPSNSNTLFVIPNRIVGTFQFGKPVLILRDPEIIKQMTIKDFDHFEDHRNLIDEKVCIML